MSKGAGRLSLGPLPRAESVKLTIAVPADLKAQLDAYAEVHGRLYGPVDVMTLIPHMLAAFIARDRGFKHQRSGKPSIVARTPVGCNPAGDGSLSEGLAKR